MNSHRKFQFVILVFTIFYFFVTKQLFTPYGYAISFAVYLIPFTVLEYIYVLDLFSLLYTNSKATRFIPFLIAALTINLFIVILFPDASIGIKPGVSLQAKINH
jgi:hypothetical protein